MASFKICMLVLCLWGLGLSQMVEACRFAKALRGGSDQTGVVSTQLGLQAQSYQRKLLGKQVTCPPKDVIQMASGPVPPQVVNFTMRQCWIKQMRKAIGVVNSQRAVKGVKPVGADMTRMVFHDCAPGSCDASVILNAAEIADPHNRNLEGASMVQQLKKSVSSCGMGISWADTIVLSSVLGIANAGGPYMGDDIPLGRGDYDGTNPHVDFLPTPDLETTDLVDHFSKIFGCSTEIAIKNLVVLSGAHTFGDATCDTFHARRFTSIPDQSTTPRLLDFMAHECPIESCFKAQFDISSPKKFDNGYYKNLMVNEGLLFSDQVIYTHDVTAGKYSTKGLVQLYAANQAKFFADFKEVYNALSLLGVRKV